MENNGVINQVVDSFVESILETPNKIYLNIMNININCEIFHQIGSTWKYVEFSKNSGKTRSKSKRTPTDCLPGADELVALRHTLPSMHRLERAEIQSQALGGRHVVHFRAVSHSTVLETPDLVHGP